MKMILLTQEQKDQVKSNYGKYSALDPVKVVEGFALPLSVLDDSEFSTIKDYLLTLPQQEVTFIVPDKPPGM